MDIKTLLQSIVSNSLVESKEAFDSIIAAKLDKKLDEAKIEVAKSLLESQKEEDEEDEESAEDEDDTKHPLMQLKRIADSKPLKDDETKEFKDDGSIDKRSKNDYQYKLPKYKHENGETSEVEPEHAKKILDALEHYSVKPDMKEKALKSLHGSKAGFQKIHSALVGLKLDKAPKEDARV